MAATEHLRSRGHRRGVKILADFGAEVYRARLAAGLSLEEVGRRVGMSADKIWRVQHAKLPTLSVVDAAQIAAVLGLDLAATTYPNGARIHDAGQAPRLKRLVDGVGTPLRYRTDVPLPRQADGPPELRAWDCVLYGHGERTAIELETRVTDLQATIRRHNSKRQDDPVDHFLLALADTHHNRRVLRDFGTLLADLPRLRTAKVLKELRRGQHPPTGVILF